MNILESVLDNIDEGLMIIDPEGVILFVSKVAGAMGSSISMDKTFQEGAKLLDLVQPNRKEALREIILETKTQKKSNRTFAEYSNSLGTTLFLETTFVPVFNDAGSVLTIQLFMRDITPRKILENKMITQAKNARNLIEKANAIIIGLDTSGYITDWNEHCCKVTGFDKAEVYTQKLTKVLLQENERPVFDLMMMRILNNELISNYELLVQTKTRKIVTLLLSATPRTTVSGNVIGVMFVGQDITELIGYRISLEQKVEERTRELKRILSKEKAVVEMKNRFVSIASHEFRTPLSSIHHAASFIRDHKKIKSADLLKKLDGIEKQVDHMTSFLNDVLIYDKSEVGKIQPVITMIKLLDFTNKIIEEVEQVTQHTHVIHPAFHEIPSVIESDEKLLRSILINLLTNAIKFSPGKGHVSLKLLGSKNQLTIEVTDQGIGIAEMEIDKIFEPFTRGKQVGDIPGTGLGLSIVKKCVEMLYGTLNLRSQPGKGTTFTAIIPQNINELCA